MASVERVKVSSWVSAWMAVETVSTSLSYLRMEAIQHLTIAILDGVIPARLIGGEAMPEGYLQQEGTSMRALEIGRTELHKWLKAQQPRTSKTGRPPVWDWEGCLIAFAHSVHEDGLPETIEEISERMRMWFIDQVDEHPGDTEIHKRARAIRKEFDR